MPTNDPVQIERWLKDYQSQLLSFANYLLKDSEKAQDVVQETFVRLWENGWESQSFLPKPWLYKVCRNLCIDFMRKDSKMKNDDEQILKIPDATSLDEDIHLNQSIKGLNKIFGSLPTTHQEVLLLKFREDLSYKEISQITGHSVSHVGVIIHTSLKELKNKLGENGLVSLKGVRQ